MTTTLEGERTMRMKIIKGKPAGKPHRIICSGCGKKAFEAGIAIDPRAVEYGYGDAPVMIVDVEEFEAQLLCEKCVEILSRSDGVRVGANK